MKQRIFLEGVQNSSLHQYTIDNTKRSSFFDDMCILKDKQSLLSYQRKIK